MKKLGSILIYMFLLFSCKGHGQTTDSVRENENSNQESFVFSGDYNDLLTLEMASEISGFEASKASKTHTMKGMMAEILRYYWDHDRKIVIEGSTFPRIDLVQIKWVDGEADMDSFLDFIDLEKHPELIKVNGVGETAYWNPIKCHLEVYYNGISFTLQIDVYNDDNIDKEKTIALAKTIIEERIN
ncbi:hypothetical protein [Formosa sp. PL04]|uniref:hypothetical protein n=1 Tax=Formosa sp. PL04 TaxID=3081755 RepID=UPI00298111B8|nr:hypothetical protein [Formosa sp. PL04]MDW5290223.1 hypothetical protein [Formosa sp. PL04]